jgi:beta-ureidopropionase
MQDFLPDEKLAAVKRVLYGANQGQPVALLELPKQAQQAAAEQEFDLQAYQFKAAAEQLRPPRIVRIGLIQHGIIKPTTAPFAEQRQVRQPASVSDQGLSSLSFAHTAL